MPRKLLCFLAFFVVLASSQAATLQFSARQDIPTPAQHLVGIAVADFNGDGHPDIAVADSYSNRLYLYLNDGTGHFGAPLLTTVTPTGYVGLVTLVAGDINEDGKQDLIIGTLGGIQSDILLLGNGDGTFNQGTSIPSTFGFTDARLADLNGDKHLDLMTGDNPTLTVLLGDGKGNFTPAPLPVSSQSGFNTGIAVGDFNGDGHPDFVTGAYNTLSLLSFLGVGDGTFRTPRTITSVFGSVGVGLDAADFNGDGKLDLLVGQPDVTFVLFGNGDGTFANQLYGPVLPTSTSPNPNYEIALSAATDLNGDQLPDIVVADDNTYILSAFLNDGTGKFLQATPDFQAALDPGTASLRVADLNGDGLPDVIVTNYKTQNISVFLSVLPKITPSVTLQSSAAQALVGSSVTVTVQVKGSGSQVPTGTVTLSSGSTSYGQQTLGANSQATFTLSNLAVGQYPLTASYSGDKYNNATANTTVVTQSITDFQLALVSATQSVAVGSSATYGVNLTGLSGFNGTVALTCSGLPSGFACAPVSSALSGQSTTVSLVVSPPVATASVGARSQDQLQYRVTLAVLGFGGLCFGFRRRRALPMLAMLLFTLLAAASTVGCGSTGAHATPYTGSSNFTITATTTQGSVTVSHQTTATLTVH